MAQKSSKHKKPVTNHISHPGSFKLRWKSGLLAVLAVAVLGIVIVRLSNAALPPEALADKTEELLNDGRYKVTVPSLGYERIFNQLDVARAQADPSYRAKLKEKVLADLEKLYNQKHPSPTPSPTPTTTDTSTSSSTPLGSTANADSAAPTSTTNLPANEGGTISTTDPSLASVQSASVDAQNPDKLTTQSGVIAFTFDKSKSTGAKTTKVFIDRKLMQQLSARQNTFNLDTTRYTNGEHRVDVILYSEDGKETVHFVYPFKILNTNSIFRSLSNTITYPWTLFFGQ
jgi:hypothetical protein